MKRYILSIIALVLFATTFYAQEQTAAATNDSGPALTKKELRKQKVARRNLHYNILGGPSYTPDFGAVLGGSALMRSGRPWISFPFQAGKGSSSRRRS